MGKGGESESRRRNGSSRRESRGKSSKGKDKEKDKERDKEKDRRARSSKRRRRSASRSRSRSRDSKSPERKREQPQMSEEERKKAEEVDKRRERIRLWQQQQQAETQVGAAEPPGMAAAGQARQAEPSLAVLGKPKVWEPKKRRQPSKPLAQAAIFEESEAGEDAVRKLPRLNLEQDGEAKRLLQNVTVDEDEDGDNQEHEKEEHEMDGTGEKGPRSETGQEEVDPLEAFMANLEENVAAVDPAMNKQQDRAELEWKRAFAAAPEKPAQRSREEKASKNTRKLEGERYFGDEEVMGEEDFDLEDDAPSWLQRKEAAARGKQLKKVDHSKQNYAPFRKDFYIEAKEISEMSEDEVKEYRETALEGVKIRGKNCPKPIKKWTQCGLPSKVLEVIERENYRAPFPIQAQAIPAIMNGRDVIACAKTGSGKTLAFVLPMLRHVQDQPPLETGEGPIAVILSPTRELCVQIYNETKKFAKPLGLRVCAVYGGASVSQQISELKGGAEIVVATPGRMIDILCANAGRVTNLLRCTYIVLDEADRMFDMGFEPQITMIVDNVRPQRQTVMFSATFPSSVERLAKKTLTLPLEIIIGGRSVASTDVTQVVEVRGAETKFRRLLEILGEWYSQGNILIFDDRQEAVDNLFRQLFDAGYPCLALHGGMDQNDRDHTIQDFKQKVRTVMVATSIIARGLDVRDLVLVVNYSVPNHYEDYVHRVGRTGRAGRKGYAITFLCPDEDRYAPDLVKALEASKQVVPDDLRQLADEYERKVSVGEEKYRSNQGFRGKGYKFDEEEAKKKKKTQLLEILAHGGTDAEGNELLNDDEKQELLAEIEEEKKKKTEAEERRKHGEGSKTAAASGEVGAGGSEGAASATAATASIASTTGSALDDGGGMEDNVVRLERMKEAIRNITEAFKSSDLPEEERLRAIKEVQDKFNRERAAELARKKALEVANIVIRQASQASQAASASASTTATASVLSPQSIAEAKAQAAAAAAKLGLSAGPATTSQGTGDADKGFMEEVEINDYPQQARWKVTNKNSLSAITQDTDVAVTTKGVFVPDGRNAPPGERKLYLQIEGHDWNEVLQVKQGIIMMLEDTANKTMPGRPTKYAKYSVV